MYSMLDALTIPLKIARDVPLVVSALTEIPALTGAVGELHAELAGLRTDLASMPADSRRLVDDVAVVHGALNAMKADLAETNASVAPVHDDLSRVEAGLAPLPNTLGALLPKIDELAGRLDEMRSELAKQLDGLRTDLSGLPFVSKSESE